MLKNIVSGLQNMEENIHQNKRKAKHYLGDILWQIICYGGRLELLLLFKSHSLIKD